MPGFHVAMTSDEGLMRRNLRIARTYPFDIANGVYVEDLSIQYK